MATKLTIYDQGALPYEIIRMVLEFDSWTLGKRDRASRLTAVKPAWRLNADRSFPMTDRKGALPYEIIPMVLEFDSWTVGKRDCAPRPMAREPAWRLNADRSFPMTDGKSTK